MLATDGDHPYLELIVIWCAVRAASTQLIRKQFSHSTGNHLAHPAVASLQHADDDLDPERTTIWFAGKALVASKKLSDYLGRHEKTKAVVKLTRAGQGAPAREQVGCFCLSTRQCVHMLLLKERTWLALSLAGELPATSWAVPKKTSVGLGVVASGGLTLPAFVRPNRACSPVEIGVRHQSEPRTAGASGVLAVVKVYWLHPAQCLSALLLPSGLQLLPDTVSSYCACAMHIFREHIVQVCKLCCCVQPMDVEAQKNMVAYWHKKQAEEKVGLCLRGDIDTHVCLTSFGASICRPCATSST